MKQAQLQKASGQSIEDKTLVAEDISISDLPGTTISLDAETQSMIENVDFTKKIIQAVADHPRFPACMTVGELAEKLQLPTSRDQELVYHLVCAYQAGLLFMDLDVVKTFQTTDYVISQIDGLTHVGSEYAHHMEGALWNKVTDWCRKQGIPLTTKVAVKFIMDWLGGGGESQSGLASPIASIS